MKQIRLISSQKSRGLKLMIISVLTSFSVFSQTPPNQQNALNSTGNVGVGTMNPDSKLQVNGSMSIDSSLTVRDSAIFQKQARMKDKVIVEGEAVIQGKLTAQDNLKVLGTTRIEGPLKLLNLNNAQSDDTTLLFINADGKVKSAGVLSLLNVLSNNPQAITVLTNMSYGSLPPACFAGYAPIWHNAPGVLWTGSASCTSIVGINTNQPENTLDVRGGANFNNVWSKNTFTVGSLAGGVNPSNTFSKVLIKNTNMGAALEIDAIGNTMDYNKLIFMQYDHPLTEILNIKPNGASYSTLLFNADGSFYIHNGTKKVLQMDANGLLKSREIIVDLQTWPDYVFKKEYTLQPLSEVATYIQNNGHLPDVPSAEEMEKNGLNVAEANKILMQKVEELTLYLIKQEETIKKQEAELKQIQEKLAKITPNN